LSLLKKKLDRRSGHDSIEDARVALDLALLKFQKGPGFGATGAESAPLGRLLRGAGTQLLLRDASGSAPPAPGAGASWHLEGCSCIGAADEHLSGSSAAKVGDTAAAEPSQPREVRVIVLRDYETLCEQGTPVDGERTSGATPAERGLAELDAKVSHIAAGTSEEELLILMSGCGDIHRLRRSQAEQAGAAVEERTQAQGAFKDAFGIFTVGGDALQARLKEVSSANQNAKSGLGGKEAAPPQREVVSYDV